jgi:hypothetical protein
MKINGFDEMNSIVSLNNNVEWDNWTVVVLTDDDGYYTKNGIFKDGVWKTQYRYEMVDYGVWEIPDRFLTHVQV